MKCLSIQTYFEDQDNTDGICIVDILPWVKAAGA